MDVVQDGIALGLVETLDANRHRAIGENSLKSRHRMSADLVGRLECNIKAII